MRRFFLPGELRETVTLTGADAHHLGFTLRARAGDRVVVVDTARQVAAMEVVAFTADSVTLRLMERLDADTEPPVALTLAMCLPKGDKMELIVQKAVELGAAAVQPLMSQNCVVRYDEKKAADRRAKWQRVADEAAKQCGRTALTAVAPVRPLTEWLREAMAPGTAGRVFMAYEDETEQPLKDWLRRESTGPVTAVIGPEGGFAPAEVEQARALGVATLSLGPRILRAETAALAVLAVLQYELGDLGGRREREGMT
ncbi:MAG: 16S rRNA (uracil(1498)-N(3))-methyltransferase [Schwartzia sp.]|nr:16S rRNA (uracil(1498)-N(3))-methyltransferase [Schwartzia sp. (in: firmicutes)]